MCPGLIGVDEKRRYTQNMSPHCSPRIQYVVGVRKALFNIGYDFGKPQNLHASITCIENTFNNA